MTLEQAWEILSNEYIRFSPRGWVVIDGTFERKQIEALIVLLRAFPVEEELT